MAEDISIEEKILYNIKRYLTSEQESGKYFNIFSIIDATRDEVKVHSAFLAELLNPLGSHGYKATFLRLFVSQMGITDFDCESAYTVVEYYIGPIQGAEGGRIDIFIADKKGNSIVIENKIDASDQEYQLYRYYNTHPQNVIYLTLYGKEPTDTSVVNECGKRLKRESYKCISYENDIRTWLSNCIEEVHKTPYLANAIGQYLNLIQQLTHKTESMERNEIKKLLENNLETSCEMNALLTEIKEEIQWRFWQKLQQKLEKESCSPITPLLETDIIQNYYSSRTAINRIKSIEIPIYEKDGYVCYWVAAIDWRFHTGFQLYEKDAESRKNISDGTDAKDLRKYIRGENLGYNCNHKDSKDWLGWKFESKEGLNFWEFKSKEIFKLTQESFMNQTIEHIVNCGIKDINMVKEWFDRNKL